MNEVRIVHELKFNQVDAVNFLKNYIMKIPRKVIHIYFLILFLSLFACGAPALKLHPFGREPQIRVGLLMGEKVINFMVSGRFAIYGPDNRFIGRGLRGIRWQARALNFTPASTVFRLRYAENISRKEAEKAVRKLREIDLRGEIVPSKTGSVSFDSREKYYDVFLWSTFPSALEAANYRAELGKSFPLEIVESVEVAAGGQIEITSEESPKKYQVPNGSRIFADKFALLRMPVGNGFHWAGRDDRVFRGMLELRVDANNQLSAINIVDAEDYLRGVVPSEMPHGFPVAALRAQAIAARSEVLKKIERATHQKDDFDICATVHCQVYGGVSAEEIETDRAVKQTRGMVLKSGGRIIDAVYSAVCGGHTENNENIWPGTAQPFLRGRFDGNGAADLLRGRLQEDKIAEKWIDKRTPVYCNTNSSDSPEPLHYLRKYFRWETRVTVQNLQSSIKRVTGVDVGLVRKILPMQRGVSGRINRLQIIGTGGSVEIDRELTIRQALHDSTLYSTCFYVEPQFDTQGNPVEFIFHGAGWGHGVGMCQAGAARMALAGKRFDEILVHYYQNAVTERIY